MPAVGLDVGAATGRADVPVCDECALVCTYYASGCQALLYGVPVGPARLVTLCGLSAAKYMLLTSSVVKADEAFRLNLVNRLAPGAATENTALELAGRIAAFDTEAVANLKRMLHKWDDIEGRSADEGRGQVEWQRHGPGLG